MVPAKSSRLCDVFLPDVAIEWIGVIGFRRYRVVVLSDTAPNFPSLSCIDPPCSACGWLFPRKKSDFMKLRTYMTAASASSSHWSLLKLELGELGGQYVHYDSKLEQHEMDGSWASGSTEAAIITGEKFWRMLRMHSAHAHLHPDCPSVSLRPSMQQQPRPHWQSSTTAHGQHNIRPLPRAGDAPGMR